MFEAFVFFILPMQIGAVSSTGWLERNLSWRGVLVLTDPRSFFEAHRSTRSLKTRVLHACLSTDKDTKEASTLSLPNSILARLIAKLLLWNSRLRITKNLRFKSPNSGRGRTVSCRRTRVCQPLGSSVSLCTVFCWLTVQPLWTTWVWTVLTPKTVRWLSIFIDYNFYRFLCRRVHERVWFGFGTQVLDTIPWETTRISVLSIRWSPHHSEVETKSLIDKMTSRRYKLMYTTDTGKLIFLYNALLKIWSRWPELFNLEPFYVPRSLRLEASNRSSSWQEMSFLEWIKGRSMMVHRTYSWSKQTKRDCKQCIVSSLLKKLERHRKHLSFSKETLFFRARRIVKQVETSVFFSSPFAYPSTTI